jgi:feruloyl-CoA synthase
MSGSRRRMNGPAPELQTMVINYNENIDRETNVMAHGAKPPFNSLRYASAAVTVERRDGGEILLRSAHALPPYPRCNGEWLEHWAAAAPGRTFMAERAGAGWRRASYAQTLAAIRSLGAALLARGLSRGRPVVVLSDNSVDHGLLSYACQYVGIPVAPLSQAYSLLSKDHEKLKAIFRLLEPGLVYVADEARFAPTIASLSGHDFELVSSDPGARATPFARLLETPVDAAVDAAARAVGPDTIAKFLFTSGSTGEPKAVINTQRMITSNQESWRVLWPFLADEPPVLVDWMPWNHTFGGNADCNIILSNGGTMYIDEGKPAPGLVEKTVANLREIAPTMYLNVPRGFDMLLPFLESDAALRRNFFSRLKLIFYAGAALPLSLWARLEKLGLEETGHRVRMVSAWGSTETAPMATCVHYDIEKAGVIGNPAPGSALKLVPVGESEGRRKYEIRVKGPNVTPGYWKRDDLTRAAFDDEGFYRIGDAVRFADENDPARGIEFAGRVAEEFKLMSGTWVHTGALRVKAIAALAPVVQDIVVTGHDREYIGFLIFPNPVACRQVAGLAADAPFGQAIASPAVRAVVEKGMRALKADGGGSSTFAERALMMEEPPHTDAGEITDKGYINQRAVLARRAPLVGRLHADAPDPGIVLV